MAGDEKLIDNKSIRVRRVIDVKQAYCPTCRQTFNSMNEGAVITRHKTPREHPGEREWDEREKSGFGLGNWCSYVGLPEIRKVGDITVEEDEMTQVNQVIVGTTIGGGA